MNNKKTIIAMCLILCLALAALVILLIGINKRYTVSFNTDGGNYIPIQTIKRGKTVSKPTDPTKEGYTFVRWELNNVAYNFSTPVKQNMALTAVWEEEVELTKYTITLNLEKETKTLEVSELDETDLNRLGFEEKEGYIIKWYLNDKEYDFTTPLESDLNLVGKYEKATTFTVKFDTDGGSSVASQTVNKDSKIKEPTSNPTKYGYIFDGWYLNNKKYDFNTPVTSNITLVAKWKEDSSVKKYTVTFNSDGKITKQTVLENNKVSQPASPTKNGYRFDGWYLNNKKYDFNSKVTSNITLTAKFTALAKYTVTFDSDGGSNVPSQTIIEGEKASRPSNPTKNGYSFKEWQLNGRMYDFDTSVTSNITLTAVWEEVQKNYTFTISIIDDYSPERKITVKEEGNEISFASIKNAEGYVICYGSNPTVNRNEIENETTITVVLNNGKTVTATKE